MVRGTIYFGSQSSLLYLFIKLQTQRSFNPPTIGPTPTQKWAVSSATVTFLLTFLVVTAQKLPHTSNKVNGTKCEMILILLLMAFTCAAVGASTNPATGLAVNSSGGVSFGNLYYSTWASFGSAFALLLSFIRTERGVDLGNELQSRGNRFRSWVVLIVTTLIVMGSSASSYDARCDVDEEVKPYKYCRRAALGVSAGCVGCVASLAVVAMRLLFAGRSDDSGTNKTVFGVEGVISVILFVMYGFAVAYLTSEKGPGAPLGNLYYSTWISFGMTFFVATSCFEEFQAAKTMILTGRRQEQQSIETDSLVSSSNVTSNNDSGRVGATPSNYRDADEMLWSDTVGRQSISTKGSSSVGEVHIS